MIFALLAKLRVLPVLLCLQILPARAQDSFVRETDPASGQPVLSALGTAFGLTYAAMALEVECPADGVWTMDLTGIHVTPGSRIVIGFGDARGSFIPVPAVPHGYAEDRLRFTVARHSFARALAQSRQEYAGQEAGELTVLVGDVVGMTFARDALAHEMAQFSTECEPAPIRAAARR